MKWFEKEKAKQYGVSEEDIVVLEVVEEPTQVLWTTVNSETFDEIKSKLSDSAALSNPLFPELYLN